MGTSEQTKKIELVEVCDFHGVRSLRKACPLHTRAKRPSKWPLLGFQGQEERETSFFFCSLFSFLHAGGLGWFATDCAVPGRQFFVTSFYFHSSGKTNLHIPQVASSGTVAWGGIGKPD